MSPVEKYFQGEKWQCSIGIFIAIIFIGLALYFLTQVKTDFYKGLAWPFLIIPSLLLVICISIIWRTPQDISRVAGFVQHEPQKIQTDEIPRMEKVMKSFETIKIVEICLLAIGIGLFIFGFFGSQIWKGVGLGLGIQALVMLGFDILAESRGKVYWEFLQSL